MRKKEKTKKKETNKKQKKTTTAKQIDAWALILLFLFFSRNARHNRSRSYTILLLSLQ